MTHTINAAINALELDKLEFAHCIAALDEEEYNDFPLPEYEKEAILLRMALLQREMDFLESCIISGLLAIDNELTTLLKPKNEVQ
jgi:hypothetical protein